MGIKNKYPAGQVSFFCKVPFTKCRAEWGKTHPLRILSCFVSTKPKLNVSRIVIIVLVTMP